MKHNQFIGVLTGVDPEILKRGDVLCRALYVGALWLTGEENRFYMV